MIKYTLTHGNFLSNIDTYLYIHTQCPYVIQVWSFLAFLAKGWAKSGAHYPWMNQWTHRIHVSKISPTYPWKVPQTFHQQFMKEFLSLWGFGEVWGIFPGYVGKIMECIFTDIYHKSTIHVGNIHQSYGWYGECNYPLWNEASESIEW